MFSLPTLADLLPLQGNVDLSGTPISSGRLVVEIWDGPDAAGSSLVYNSTENFTGSGNISSGTFDIVLGNALDKDQLNLQYGKTYYMDLYIAGNDMNFSGQERQAFMSSVGTINSSFLNTSNDYTFNSLLIENKTIAVDDAYLNISDGMTSKFLVSPDGKVGIGTTSPAFKLDVYGLVNATAFLMNDTSCTNGLVTDANGLIYCSPTPHTFDDTSINATHANDNATIWANLTDISNIFSNYFAFTGLGSELTNDLDWGTPHDPSNLAWINETTLNDTYARLNNVNTFTELNHFNANVSMDDNLTIGGNVLYVDSSAGRVGIGTLSPSKALEVVGDVAVHALNATSATVANSITVQDSLSVSKIIEGAGNFIVDTSGKVGIGTTSPDVSLHIETADPQVIIEGDFSPTDPYLILRDYSNANSGLQIWYDSSAALTSFDSRYKAVDGQPWGDMRFRVNATTGSFINVMYFEGTNGNVGIGTTSPASLLNVDGDLNVSETGKSDLLFADTSANNVTIGESGGTFEDLIVYGNVYQDGTTVTFSPFVVESGDGLPVPICMKNSAGVWIGCMPDENNNWVCAPNKACDEKILRVEITRKLSAEGVADEEIDHKIESLKKKFKQDKTLKAIKDEVKAEIGEMKVLDELDDTESRGITCSAQGQDVSADVSSKIDRLDAENDVLKGEVDALKEELAELKASLSNKRQSEITEQPTPVEEQSAEQLTERITPTEEPQQEDGFSITGASIWQHLSDLFQK